MTPTARSLGFLRSRGYTCQRVEHWNPFGRRRVDLFGGLDVVAVREDIPGVLGVQCTTATNQSKRRAKLQGEPRIKTWLRAGNRVEVHGWSKRGQHNGRKTWHVSVIRLESPTGLPGPAGGG